MDDMRRAGRREVLRELGAEGPLADEILAYTDNPFDIGRLAGASLPLADEPHVTAWTDYAREAEVHGVFTALARRLVQLRFPIAPGISQTEDYRAATRRGRRPGDDRPGLGLERPGDLELTLHPTLAGRVPVLVAPHRPDFVALVQACSARNEPEVVPDSMGACIVTGLNNWDRVERHRAALGAARGAALSEGEWAEAFRDLVPRKEQYQDRFIILSREPYSAVPAGETGLTEAEWRERSVAIRLEHECTHYFTLRAFGVMRNNLLDEVLADCAGLCHAFGRYDGRLALRFFGLDTFPSCRPDGRLGLYLGALSPGAVGILRVVLHRAVTGLDECLAGHDLRSRQQFSRVIVALAGLTLEEMGGSGVGAHLAGRLAQTPAVA